MEVRENALEIIGRHKEFWSKDLKGIGHLEDLDVEGNVILK
jgi:hypothetical protein